jgi:thiamine pyrophosphate-dependent acetolactate synthase large subunit-like protein
VSATLKLRSPAVSAAIGGSGVTNTITALASALTDKSPVLLVSGEVPRDWEGRSGFQHASAAGLNDLQGNNRLWEVGPLPEEPYAE